MSAFEAFAEALNVPVAEFVKQVLRYQNPWAYAGLFGKDAQLRAELDEAPDRANARRGPIKRVAHTSRG